MRAGKWDLENAKKRIKVSGDIESERERMA